MGCCCNNNKDAEGCGMLIGLIFMIMMLISCVGCATYYGPTEPVARSGPSTGYMVVNNSGAVINVVQDGQVIAERIEPGQVVPIRPVWLRTTCIVAIGYTPEGDYVGTDSYIFQSNVRETWTINRLIRPQTFPSW